MADIERSDYPEDLRGGYDFWRDKAESLQRALDEAQRELDRRPTTDRGAVEETQRLRDRVADLESALEHYAATSATDPWVARDALTTPGGR